MSTARCELIPFSELKPGEAAAIRNAAEDFVLGIASREAGVPIERLVVRDIRPNGDLDYGTEDFDELTGSTTGAYETMSTGTMASDRWVGFYGVRDASPSPGAVSFLRFNVGGGDRALWNLQNLKAGDDYVGFSPSVVLIPQNDPYTISRYVVRAGLGAHIVLRGFVIETRGKVISP